MFFFPTRFVLIVGLFFGLASPAFAQLTVEELVSLRAMPKTEALAFLQGKGYKLDSCGPAPADQKEVTSRCLFKAKRQAEQKLQVSEVEMSFSKVKKNYVYYTPFQPGFGGRVSTYLKGLKAKEEDFDDIKDGSFGKRYHQDGFTYDAAQSTKKPAGWEAIYIYPSAE